MNLSRWLKWLCYSLVLVALVAAASPLLCGYWLQQRIAKDIDALQTALNNHQLQHIRIVSEAYQRGWLSSTHTMQIAWQGSDQVLLLQHQLSHGPLPWVHLKQGLLQPQLAAGQSHLDFSRAQWPFVMPELKFSSVVDFAGNVDVEWRFLGYRNEHPEGLLDVASSQGEMHFAKSEKRLYGELSIPDIRLGLNPNQKWTLSGLMLNFDFSRGDSVLPVGALQLQLDAARGQLANAEYRVQGLQQKLQLSEFDRLSNIQYVLEAQSLLSPSWSLQQVSSDSILRGISELSLSVLTPQQSPSSFGELFNTLLAQVKNRAPELLSGTEFEIAHFEALLPEGKTQGFLRTQVPELQAVAEMAPRDLLKAINMSAELSVPQSLLHNVLADGGIQEKFQLSEKYRHLKRRLPEEQLNSLAQEAATQQLSVVVAQGLVRQDQGQYWSSIELKEGALSFNGHQVHGF